MRILICSDGSKWALKSARFALQLFRHTAHELTILAFRQRAAYMSPTKKRITRATRQKEDNLGAERPAIEITEELQDLMGELSIDARELVWEQQEGDMARHILDIADGYDLICLGGAGKGAFSQNLLGMIADEVVMKGHGNLMVTKTSDMICQNILVAVTPDSLSEDLAHHLGTLFQGSPASICIEVLWEALTERFEGYLDASSRQRVAAMVDADLFDDPEHLENILAIIESYGVDCSAQFRDFRSLNQLIDHVEPASYDLIIIHPPPREASLLNFLGSEKESLTLMRKSSPNVMLLRSVPGTTKA